MCRAGDGLELLPGVLELLQRLQQRDDVAVGLVTGNLEPIGWAKMDALGIKHLFSDPLFGGFGTDHCSGDVVEMWRDRAEFIRIANKKVPGAFAAPPLAPAVLLPVGHHILLTLPICTYTMR